MMAVAEDCALAVVAGFHQPDLFTRGQNLVSQVWKALQIHLCDARRANVFPDQLFEGVLARTGDGGKNFLGDAEYLASFLAGKAVIEDTRFLFGRNISLQYDWCADGCKIAGGFGAARDDFEAGTALADVRLQNARVLEMVLLHV